MIVLIGTGHVFDLSSSLLSIFDERNPEVICVELDKQRYNALMLKVTDPEKYKETSKNQPFIYRLLSRFQEGMANEYGVVAGDEMLTAINYAKGRFLPVMFIDMNAQNLFSRMLKSMPISEKFKLMFSGFSGLFISKKRVEKELSKFEKNFDTYIEQIGDKFPTIKRVLIDERNEYMVQHLVKINEDYSSIVAVMGDGHIPGVSELLESKEIEFETIRLSELRSQKLAESDSASVSITYQYKEN
jgi:pheromone shutdown protein TraB